MTPQDRKRRIAEVYQLAVDLPTRERGGFLESACGGDEAMRIEVESLLLHLEQAGTDYLGRAALASLDPSDSDHLPEKIGSYRILGIIGEGGMGVVYDATQDAPRRRVALKVIRPGFCSPQQLRRFQIECEVLGRLQHPGIAQVYEAGLAAVVGAPPLASIPPSPFLSMERIEGEPLDAYVRQRGLSDREVLRLMANVCDAVQHAHQKGIVHRDLKPANILVTSAGQPKILDFGIARALDPDLQITAGTIAGQVLGTLPYMSPEQLGAVPGDVDTRTDVYALGAILYQLLVGRTPHDLAGVSLLEAIQRVGKDRLVPPRAVRSDLDADIDTIIVKALDRLPARRYESASALGQDMRRHLAGEPIEARGDSRWYVLRKRIRRYRWPIAGAAAFIGVLIASSIVAWSLYLDAERARGRATRNEGLATERLYESYLERARAGTTSRTIGRRFDGLRTLAAAGRIRPSLEARNEAIACLALSDLRLEERITGTDGVMTAQGLYRIDRCAVALPDGSIRVISPSDGTELARLPGPSSPVTEMTFSPHGRYLAAKYHRGSDVRLWIWDVDGEEPIARFDDGRLLGGGIAFGPAQAGMSRSSDAVAAIASSDGTVRILDLPSGREMRRIRPGIPAYRLAVDRTGGRLAVIHHSTPVLEIWDVASGNRIRSLPAHTTGLFAVDWSWDGRRIAAGAPDYTIHVWDLDRPDAARVMTGHQGSVIRVSFLQDNRTLVSHSWDNTARLWDLESGQEIFEPLLERSLLGCADRIALRQPPDTLEIWGFVSPREVRLYTAPATYEAPGRIDMGKTGEQFVTAGRHGVLLWDPERSDPEAVLSTVPARAAVFLPARGRILAADDEGLRAWFLEDLGRSELLLARAGIEEINVLSDHEVILAGGDLLAYDIDRRTVRTVAAGYRGMNSVETAPGGRWAFTGTWHGEDARVWDLERAVAILRFPGKHVRGRFSGDGLRCIVSDKASFMLFDTSGWKEVARLDRPQRASDLAGSASFSPDGEHLAVAMNPYRIDILQLPSGRTVATLPNPQRKSIQDLEFSRDGACLAGLTNDREAILWDLALIRRALAEISLDWEGAEPPPWSP